MEQERARWDPKDGIADNDLTLNVTSRPLALSVAVTDVSTVLVETPLSDAQFGSLELTRVSDSSVVKTIDFHEASEVSGNTVKANFKGLNFEQYLLHLVVTDETSKTADEKFQYCWPDAEVPAPQITSNDIAIDNSTTNGKATITFNKVEDIGSYQGKPVCDISGYRFDIIDGSNGALVLYASQPAETESTVTVVLNGAAVGTATTTSNPIEQNTKATVVVRTQYVNTQGGDSTKSDDDKAETGTGKTTFHILLGDEVSASKGAPEHEIRPGFPKEVLLNIDNDMAKVPGGDKPQFTIGSLQRRVKSTENWTSLTAGSLLWATGNASAQLAVSSNGIPGTVSDKLYDYRLKAAYAGKSQTAFLEYLDVSSVDSPAAVTLMKFEQSTATYYTAVDASVDNAELPAGVTGADYTNMWFKGPQTHPGDAIDPSLNAFVQFKLASQTDICASGLTDFSVNLVFLGLCGDTNDYDTVLHNKSYLFTDACGGEVYKYNIDTDDISGVDVSLNLLNGKINNGANTFKLRLDVSNNMYKNSELTGIQKLISLPDAPMSVSVKSIGEDDPLDLGTNKLGAKIQVSFDISGNDNGKSGTAKFPGNPGAAGNNMTKVIIKVAPVDLSKNEVKTSELNKNYNSWATTNGVAATPAGQAAWVAEKLAYNKAINAGVTKEITTFTLYDPLDTAGTTNKVVIDGLAYGEAYDVNVYTETSEKLRSATKNVTPVVPGGQYSVPEPTKFFIDISGSNSDHFDVSLSIPTPNQKLYDNSLNSVTWKIYEYDAEKTNQLGNQVRNADTENVDLNGDGETDQWQRRFNQLTKGKKYRIGGAVNAVSTEGAVLPVDQVYYDLILTSKPDIESFSFDGQYLTVTIDAKGATFISPSYLISNANFHDAAGQNAHAIEISDKLNALAPNSAGNVVLTERIYTEDEKNLQELVIIASNAMGTDVSGTSQLDSNLIEH